MNQSLIRWTGILSLICGSSVAIAGPLRPLQGVGGVGNTMDLTTQLEFARQTSIDVLKAISVVDLDSAGEVREVADLYRDCRESMYRGTIRTRFEIVDEIPDGSGFHAIAQRDVHEAKTIVSRSEIEKLAQMQALSATFLVVLVLHEATHDCVVAGKAVGDSYDSLINQMAMSIYQTARKAENRTSKDLEFVAKVEDGRPVSFRDLSPDSQEVLSEAYIDYLGDWLYDRNASLFKFRPAPASDFYATRDRSRYPGWAYVREALDSAITPEIQSAVFGVMKPSFEEKSLFYYRDSAREELPSRLDCMIQRNPFENLVFASCHLTVSWSELPQAELRIHRQVIEFELDSLGRVRIRTIRFD